jgi:light-regulated signal transduction histidine kinase (bacteriophytochrome)
VDAFNDMLDEIANRTSALESSNRELGQEVAERMRAREEVLKLNDELEYKVMERTQQLQLSNQELETFCYSVSHDLRGPLRAISGFSQALREELPAELPGDARRYFDKIIAATHRMGQLIEDLLNLSRVSRVGLVRQAVNCSELATEILTDLKQQNPAHRVHTEVWSDMVVNADHKLLRIVFENLLGNAWKFSSKQANPRIEVGTMRDGNHEVYFVRDNGAGFDMKYADKLFGPFQRLHAMNEYPGTGIGLATVQRVIHRHGGRIWFDSKAGHGAVFYFTLDADFNMSERG